jgi:4-hydroxybenzoate polyprenyltransferase
VTPQDLSRINTAFFHVNAVISIGLLLVGGLDLWWTFATKAPSGTL